MKYMGRWMLILLATLTVAACNVSSSGGSSDSDDTGGGNTDTNTDTGDTGDTGGDTGGDSGGDSGDDGGDTTQSNKTRLSGTVTLSSSVAGSNKPGDLLMQGMSHSPRMKTQSDGSFKVANKPILNGQTNATARMAAESSLSNAFVYVYDADHPEWLAPVAQDKTNSEGAYDISLYGCTANVQSSDCVATAASNDNQYVDGDPLPTGKYTMLVFKPSSFDPISGVTTDSIVAVMPAFKAEDESVTVENVEAEVSDVTPRVVKMFGKAKNTDGTNSWGSDALELAPNSAIQVTFDMSMSRGSVQNIDVTNGSGDVAGAWKLSADWLTATFHPDQPLSAGTYEVYVPDFVTNVYGNAMGDAATGSFTALAETDSTAPTVSLTSPTATTGVKTSDPIRISSNEALDVNGLNLEATPDVGVPGVLFVGETNGNFVYEFILGKPLQLATSYDYSINGIADLSGNVDGTIEGSFTTEGATEAEGVDDTATTETQTAQSAISEIFGKWVRAINDRNLSQLQSMMSGSFVFEYSVLQEGFMDEDVNRNGRLSLNEFMAMMEKGLTHWEYCGTTITGNIESAINVSAASNGDFEFSLSSETDNQSQECLESGPQESMFASVKNSNGAWKLSRMSEGFDHRGSQLQSFELLEAILSDDSGNDIANGGTLNAAPTSAAPLTFRFDTSVQGVDSYILLVANARHPSELGIAIAISESNLNAVDGSTTLKSVTVPDASGSEGMPAGAVNVSELFGFETDRDWGIERSGEAFLWEIIGLDTLTPGDFSDGESMPSVSDLVRDFAAVSAVKKFKNPGERKQLRLGVTDEFGQSLTFDEFIWGYDAGSSDGVDITVSSPNVDMAVQNGGFLYLNSNSGFSDHPLSFSDNGDGTASATVSLPLFQGWNWVTVEDGGNLYKDFQIHTDGGQAPAVEASTINALDAMGSVLGAVTLNEWNFADAPSGTTALDVTWTVDTSNTKVAELIGALCSESGGWADLNVWVHNNNGAYGQYNYCQDPSAFTLDEMNGTITVADMAIYSGENWINLDLSGDPNGTGNHSNVSTHFGVYTDTGSTFVAPVTVDPPTTSEGTLKETGNWGQGSDWNATDVTVDTTEVTITGAFDEPGMGFYNAGADGAHMNGEIDASVDGTFSFTVSLYNGWNWIGIDNGNGDFYNLNIYTDNGATLPRPEIVDVNTVTPVDDFGQWVAHIDSCTATINGTAPGNSSQLWIDWQGSTEESYYWENQEVLLAGDGAADGEAQSWSATFQVIGGTGAYNFINVYDETNGTWAGVEIRTSNAECSYTEPMLEVTSMVDGNGNTLVSDMDTYGVDGGEGFPEATTASTVTINGTSTIPGRNVKLATQACGSKSEFSAQASDTANGNGSYDWSAQLPIYDPDAASGNQHHQWIDINDGHNWFNVTVLSDNNQTPPAPPITVTMPNGMTELFDDGCGYREWDAGDASGQLMTVTLSGTTDGSDGSGEFWAGNNFGTFQITDGSFSFDVDLYDGNNWININDADWNEFRVNIQVTNGEPRPQFVYITSPTHGTDNLSGPIEVTGDFGDSGFVPDFMEAWVHYQDPNTGNEVFQEFDSNLVEPMDGRQPMTYDPENPASGFSLNTELPSGVEWASVEVQGCGPEGCRGHRIDLNDGDFGGDDHYWKAGSGQPTAEDRARMRRIQAAHQRH